MEKLFDVSVLKKGDKLLRVEYNQGLNGHVERMDAHVVTVGKITKAKVHIIDDVYNMGFAIRKAAYNPHSGFCYGKKVEYFTSGSDALEGSQLSIGQ